MLIISITEIPGSSKKSTNSILETNDVLRSRPFHSATPSPSPSLSHNDPDDFYRTSDEIERLEEEEDEDEDAEDSMSRFVSITNPTRTTTNSFTKHVPTAAGGDRKLPPNPPLFGGPELVQSSAAVLVSCRIWWPVVVLAICCGGRLLIKCQVLACR